MKIPASEPFDSNITSGENKSFWTTSTQSIIFSALKENIETDILIVGVGISGLTTAYYLLKSGRKIILVEDGYVGSEGGNDTKETLEKEYEATKNAGLLTKILQKVK